LTVELAIAYVSILAMALLPIYLGAHLSLQQKSTETLTWESAWAFPFIGSAVLFGLYILFKVFSKEYINLLMTAYFVLFGIAALTASISQLLDIILPYSKKNRTVITLSCFWQEVPTSQSFTVSEVISFILAMLLGVWYFTTKHWIANNLFGLSFCIQAISLFSMGSYQIGCLLLVGLFFYDIFWVFGTDVMVTVAKSFDAPVKLLFPRNIFADQFQFSMLGLGDIVIPGFFIALLLRFDLKNSETRNDKVISKPFFNATFIGYTLGLVTTFVVMHTFQAAQPALLYLVPFCIVVSALTGVVRGEFRALWQYSEEEKPAEGTDQGNSSEDSKTTNSSDSAEKNENSNEKQDDGDKSKKGKKTK